MSFLADFKAWQANKGELETLRAFKADADQKLASIGVTTAQVESDLEAALQENVRLAKALDDANATVAQAKADAEKQVADAKAKLENEASAKAASILGATGHSPVKAAAVTEASNVMTRSEFQKLSSAAQMKFCKAGGTISDNN